MAKDQNKPIKTFGSSNIFVSVWENKIEKDDNKFKVYSVTVQRGYPSKEDKDKLEYTNNLRTSDIANATFLMQKAFNYIIDLKKD